MAVVKRVGPASAFKLGLLVYAVLGLMVGVFFSLIALAGAPFARNTHIPGALLALLAVVLFPILYGITGGIFFAISAFIYNLASGWVGGLEVEIN
jgi:hypothetical protein